MPLNSSHCCIQLEVHLNEDLLLSRRSTQGFYCLCILRITINYYYTYYVLLSTHLILAEMVTDGVLLRFDAGSLKSRVLFKLCNDIYVRGVQ